MKPTSIATFKIDITPPIGTPLCGGAIKPATTVDDPQYAIGFVLLGSSQPIVLATIDCVGLYSETHDLFLEAIAQAAGTTIDHVILASVHQHDSPSYFLDGRDILDSYGIDVPMYDRDHVQEVLGRLAKAVRDALKTTRHVTHIGTGRSKVDRVASNRRVRQPDGSIKVRWSAVQDKEMQDAPEGIIDPYLKAITLFDGVQPVVRLYHYAVHPMSHYGKGAISADFCGLARQQRQEDEPDAMHIFVNGCAGNITAGKYNDGSPQSRIDLTQRMHDAMCSACDNTQQQLLTHIAMRATPMMLSVRDDPYFTEADAQAVLRGELEPIKDYAQSAYVLAWRKRCQRPINVPLLDLGAAKLLQLPSEPFIEYQLAAQQLSPDDFLMVMGYGNSGPGYVCTDIAYDEGGYESGRVGLTGRGAEAMVKQALREALT